jgi:hypothetical protein
MWAINPLTPAPAAAQGLEMQEHLAPELQAASCRSQHIAKMPALAGTPPDPSHDAAADASFPHQTARARAREKKKAGPAAAVRRPGFAQQPPPAAARESMEVGDGLWRRIWVTPGAAWGGDAGVGKGIGVVLC